MFKKNSSFLNSNILFIFLIVYYSLSTLNLNFISYLKTMSTLRQRGLFSFILLKPSCPQSLMWLTLAMCCLLSPGSPGRRAEQTAFCSGVVGIFFEQYRDCCNVQRLYRAVARSRSCPAVGALPLESLLFHMCFCSTQGLFSAHPLCLCKTAG